MSFITKLICAILLALAAYSTQASIVIDYDASVLPNNHTPPFEFVQFSGTTATINNNQLKLTTAPVRGIWFGYRPSANLPWSLGSNANGNYLSLTMKLSDQATDWSMYILDDTSNAGFSFDHDRVQFSSADQSFDIQMDLTDDFHQFDIELINGKVSFRIDNQVFAYQHNAHSSGSASPIMLVGDGSGSTPTGTGSMTIDHFTYNGESNNTIPAIPEPGTIMILALTSACLLRRNYQA